MFISDIAITAVRYFTVYRVLQFTVWELQSFQQKYIISTF